MLLLDEGDDVPTMLTDAEVRAHASRASSSVFCPSSMGTPSDIDLGMSVCGGADTIVSFIRLYCYVGRLLVCFIIPSKEHFILTSHAMIH